MSQRCVCWINVSQNATHRQWKAIIFSFVLLEAGALSVSYRAHLCQAQAYAIIVLAIIAMANMLLYGSLRRDSVVEIKKEVYCADLSKSSHIAVTPGRLSADVVSSYERLYFSQVRLWLPLLVWLVWVAYGALFHSGPHSNNVEHELLVDLGNVGESTPALLKEARLYALAFCGIGSILLTGWFRRDTKDGTSSSVIVPVAEQRWQSLLWLLFALLLFFPSRESTAQALVPSLLAARTALFFVLFVLSESMNRLVHYERWLRCYRAFTQAILVAIQIALGGAKPMTLKEDRIKDMENGIDTMAPPPPAPRLRRPNSATLISSELVKYCSIMQSAWILLASERFYPVAFAQVLAILVTHAHMRKTMIAVARERSTDFFVVNQDPGSLHLPFSSRSGTRNNLPVRRTIDPEDIAAGVTDGEQCLPLPKRRQSPPTSARQAPRASRMALEAVAPAAAESDQIAAHDSDSEEAPRIIMRRKSSASSSAAARAPEPDQSPTHRAAPTQSVESPLYPSPSSANAPSSTSLTMTTTTTTLLSSSRKSESQLRKLALARLGQSPSTTPSPPPAPAPQDDPLQKV
jgi:hypothetical protein